MKVLLIVAVVAVVVLPGCQLIKDALDTAVGTNTDVPIQETPAGQGTNYLPYGLGVPALILLEVLRRKRKASKKAAAPGMVV